MHKKVHFLQYVCLINDAAYHTVDTYRGSEQVLLSNQLGMHLIKEGPLYIRREPTRRNAWLRVLAVSLDARLCGAWWPSGASLCFMIHEP